MLLEDYIKRLNEDSPDYPDVKTSLDKVASAANKANDDIAKLVRAPWSVNFIRLDLTLFLDLTVL